jgi:endonuclease/exonuclease/phosphatase family metal-dependent hydrolase
MPLNAQPIAALRGRLAFLAIALTFALLGAMSLSALDASSAGAAQTVTAQSSSASSQRSIASQARNQCRRVKGAAQKRRCIASRTRVLKRKAAARARARAAARRRARARARARAIAIRDKGKVGVMSRNVYLGADLGPAIRASSIQQFVNANGEILRNVDENNFPVRARGLAAEIISKSPDLVGLQEVALWRTSDKPTFFKNKPNDPPESFTSKTVKYDYLQLLMDQLNKGKQRYRVVTVTNEFDFEGPANYDGSPDGVGEINGRLTMRDAILAKVGADIKTRNPQGANYSTFYAPVISGFNVTVDRGWNSAEVKVRNSPWFKFVNTHLESFGDDKNKVVDCMTTPPEGYESNPVSIRCSQAKELAESVIAPSSLPVVLTGDLNSDDNTVVDANCPSAANTAGTLPGNNGGVCGDTFAYNALLSNGLTDLSTEDVMSCCLNSDVLTDDRGSLTDFDHHIDHIMTNQPAKVKGLSTSITGLAPANGYWNSDHAGDYTLMRITP